MKSIYLTGFMGVGKSTLGQALSEKLQLPAYDTDAKIEEKTGLKIKEIFEKYGEKEFRFMEARILREMPASNAIITTGGGIVTSSENIQWMQDNGLMIFLYADIDSILQRLENDESRPLAMTKSNEELKSLFAERLPYYNQANLVVDTTSLTIQEAADLLHKKIKSLNSGQH